jgi:hypothetical protein
MINMALAFASASSPLLGPTKIANTSAQIPTVPSRDMFHLLSEKALFQIQPAAARDCLKSRACRLRSDFQPIPSARAEQYFARDRFR